MMRSETASTHPRMGCVTWAKRYTSYMKILRALRPAFAVAILATNAFAWSGRVHMDINRAAALNVPDEMAAWRDYAKLLGLESIRPDLWKGADETEGPRHYLDAERYRPLAITNLPAVRARVRALTGSDAVENGLLPWIIIEVENRLAQAMAGNDWEEAARYAAALGHYVGDAHQPLHLTEHYDGSRDPNGKGIHMRWEEEMPFFYWKETLIRPGPAEYVKDPWSAVLKQLDQAHGYYRELYAADKEAREASDEQTDSPDYYRAIWKRTQKIFVGQVSDAVTDLSSLWYTAWIRAGRPPIPTPPKHVSDQSIWVEKPKQVINESSFPIVVICGAAGLLVVLLILLSRRL